MKKFLKIFLFLLSVIIILLGIFIYWGSSMNISEELFNKGFISDAPGKTKTGEKSYSIMTYNVGFASGMANSSSYQPDKDYYDKNLKIIIKLLQNDNPDLLAVQEIDINSNRSFYVDQVKSIGSSLKYHKIVFAPNFSKNYVPFPYWPPSAHWGSVYSGQALFSRFAVKNHTIFQLDPPESFSWIYLAFYLGRAIQKTTVIIDGKDFVIFNVHLEAWDGPIKIHT